MDLKLDDLHNIPNLGNYYLTVLRRFKVNRMVRYLKLDVRGGVDDFETLGNILKLKFPSLISLKIYQEQCNYPNPEKTIHAFMGLLSKLNLEQFKLDDQSGLVKYLIPSAILSVMPYNSSYEIVHRCNDQVTQVYRDNTRRILMVRSPMGG